MSATIQNNGIVGTENPVNNTTPPVSGKHFALSKKQKGAPPKAQSNDQATLHCPRESKEISKLIPASPTPTTKKDDLSIKELNKQFLLGIFEGS